jgi:hypothetical protein
MLAILKRRLSSSLYCLLCIIVGSLYDIWNSLHPFVVYAVIILVILPLLRKDKD